MPMTMCLSSTASLNRLINSKGFTFKFKSATSKPPKMLTASATATMKGIAKLSASTRGRIIKRAELKPIVFIALISSVIFITPICAVYELALRPAMTMAAIKGAISLVAEMPTKSTMKMFAPNCAS